MLYLLLALSSFLVTSNAVFVLIRQDKKCFYIEQPESTPMTITYNVLDDEPLNAELYRGTVANAESRIKHKTLKKSGHIDYETETDDFHLLCFSQIDHVDRPTVTRMSTINMYVLICLYSEWN